MQCPQQQPAIWQGLPLMATLLVAPWPDLGHQCQRSQRVLHSDLRNLRILCQGTMITFCVILIYSVYGIFSS
jgi:hypothetical protein